MLAAVGAPKAVDTPLGTFLTEALQLDPALLKQLCPANVLRQATVQHLRSIFLFLEGRMMGGGPLSTLHPRYRAPLGDDLKEMLDTAIRGQLRVAVVLAAVRDLVTGPLADPTGSWSSNDSLKQFLGFVDAELGMEPWFNDHFPDPLKLAHAGACLALLSAAAAQTNEDGFELV
mmetsp:Transcript_61758/g.165412  ORF Transcript_61758/g.165412 Transcript_61758/m.165412 type:complete len:174 (-) Transcript_61758:266-787(-)